VQVVTPRFVALPPAASAWSLDPVLTAEPAEAARRDTQRLAGVLGARIYAGGAFDALSLDADHDAFTSVVEAVG
jgi:hypothetical protein